MARLAVLALGLIVSGLVGAQDKVSKPTRKEQLASKLVTEAADLMKQMEWEKGIRKCDAALRLDPDNVNARWMRGLGYLKTNEPDKAIADFSDAIKRDAKMAPSYRDRGLAYVEKKELDRAIADFNRYISLRPEDPNGYHERGLAYQAKGVKEKAEADFRKAKQLEERAKAKKD
jgi:regulator of sirC expression with transglutaminase-like and TPR domain